MTLKIFCFFPLNDSNPFLFQPVLLLCFLEDTLNSTWTDFSILLGKENFYERKTTFKKIFNITSTAIQKSSIFFSTDRLLPPLTQWYTEESLNRDDLFPSFVYHCCHIGDILHLPKFMQSEYYSRFTILLLCKTKENAITHVKRIEAAMLVLSPILNRRANCYTNLYSYVTKLVVKTTETSSLPNMVSAF